MTRSNSRSAKSQCPLKASLLSFSIPLRIPSIVCRIAMCFTGFSAYIASRT